MSILVCRNDVDKSAISSSSLILRKDLYELSLKLQESQEHLNKLENDEIRLNEALLHAKEKVVIIRNHIKRNEYEKYTETELLSRLQQVQLQVEHVSASEVIRRFGDGPYHVQVNLELPPSLFPDTEESSTVLEMTPLEYQPAAIYTFLSQVENKMWTRETNATIYRNAPHMIQARSDASIHGLFMPFHEKSYDNFKNVKLH